MRKVSGIILCGEILCIYNPCIAVDLCPVFHRHQDLVRGAVYSVHVAVFVIIFDDRFRFFRCDAPLIYRGRLHIGQDCAHKSDRLAVFVSDQLDRIAIDANVSGNLSKCIADIFFRRSYLRQLQPCGTIRADPVIYALHCLVGFLFILDHAVIKGLTDKSSNGTVSRIYVFIFRDDCVAFPSFRDAFGLAARSGLCLLPFRAVIRGICCPFGCGISCRLFCPVRCLHLRLCRACICCTLFHSTMILIFCAGDLWGCLASGLFDILQDVRIY